MSARCKSCGADILWAKTERGKFIPFDAVPKAQGSHVLLREYGADVPKPVPFADLTPLEGCAALDRHDAHFASCPNAARHRAKKE